MGAETREEERHYAAGFEDEARGHKPRSIAGLQKLKKWPRCDSLREPRNGMQPYKHLDFSPVKLISDF